MREAHRKLLDDHEVGRITSTGFILDLLDNTNRNDLKEVLDVIPLDLLNKLRDFVAIYRPGMLVFRGPAPDPSVVSMAKELLTVTVKST